MKIKIFVILLLTILGFLTWKSFDKGGREIGKSFLDENKRQIKLGYCPTMRDKAGWIQNYDYEIVLVELESAGQVLEYLTQGQVALGLIGRKARRQEIGNQIEEIVIDKQGLTLVANNYQVMAYDELAGVPIKTSLEKDMVISKLADLSFEFDKSDKILADEIRLMAWDEFNYSQGEIVVVVDENGDKVKALRAPFLYFSNDSGDLVNKLLTDIRANI